MIIRPNRFLVVRQLVFAATVLGTLACGKQKARPEESHDGGDDQDADGGGGGDVQVANVDGAAGPGCPALPAARPASTPSWSSISGFRNLQAWYTTDAAAYVAENLMYYQNGNGGWPKNIDMSLRYGVDAGASARITKSMIDNSATTSQIRYLATMLTSWPTCQRYLDGFNSGMGFLFNAQYSTNGGWPQVWPIEPTDYSRHITYNDNAMVHVMQIMRDISYGIPLYKFVSADTLDRATTALGRGVDCMLKTQIISGGKKTGWCAQHDEVTLLPANARAYELISQSGKEGAQVMGFLMTLDLARTDVPKQDVIDAVEGAVLFYDSVKILGTRYVQGVGDAGADDSWIESDPLAAPIWARFYDVDSPFRPFFCGRDGVKKYTLAEIELERRGGYAWYGTDPASILNTTYPTWVTKWAIGRNVLAVPLPGDGGASDDAAAEAGDDGPAAGDDERE